MSGSLSLDHLRSLLEEARKHKLVAMFELHDATGSSNDADLMRCAQWLKDNMSLFNNYKRTVLLNIANEWVFIIIANES